MTSHSRASLLSTFPLAALLTAISFLSFALPGRARADVAPVVAGYSITPVTAFANTPFTLYLNGASANCNTVFSRESVTVVGKRINLSFTANTVAVPVPLAGGAPANDVLLCPVYTQINGDTANTLIPFRANIPTFSIPALDAGSYEVYASQVPGCVYSNPRCEIAVLPVFAGTLTVDKVARKPYTISPDTTGPGQAFDLNLLSYDFNCANYYDNLNVSVTGNAITLTFLDHEKVGVLCPAIYRPYGPTFKMPALKSGSYQVTSYRLPACYPCKSAGEIMPAGTLTVTGGGKADGWFLKNKETQAGQPFTMQLLNNAYGNCQTRFSHQSISTQNGAITASFQIELLPVVCITDIRPYGPSFEMQALKAGMYPILVEELQACEVNPPYCAIKRPPPVPSDTLIVSRTTSVLLSELRARGPQVEMNGSRAALVLPQGIGGTWKAVLMTVSGKRIASAAVSGEGGSRAEFDLGANPKPGVYLLRLQAPDGETHMLPIVR